MPPERSRQLIGNVWRYVTAATSGGGGGTTPVQATYSQNVASSIANGASTALSFTTLDAGDDLLDRSAPAAPTFLADGVYWLTVRIFAPAPLTSGGYMVGVMQSGDLSLATETSEHPEDNVTLSGAIIASAGDPLVVTVTNHDGVASRDFIIASAVVVLLPGTVGAQGEQGEQGDPGAPGVGVPAGGSTDEVLAKASDADFDTAWTPPGPGGSSNFSVADRTFTEVATAGTYTATVTLPARSFVIDVGYWAEEDWAADTMLLNIGDSGGNWVEAQDIAGLGHYEWQSAMVIANGSPASVAPNLTGKAYAASDAVTIELTTTIAVPPVTPTGLLRARVLYCTAPAPVAATFA